MKRSISAVFFICLCAAIFAGGGKEKKETVSIAVFVPGIVSGSPVYEMLVSGVTKAADEYNAAGPAVPASVEVIEAGTNQAEWGSKMTALAAEGRYNVIISSNPSLPEIIEPLTKQFPNQKYIILDALKEGNPSIATARYNQRQEAYLAGYMAGLVTVSSMKYANGEKKIGFIAAQEYPVMNEILLPSFIEGAKAVDPGIEIDFRVVGNWYDASRGADLARSIYQNGADVILPIAGGANQGVLSAAKELGFYVTWFDDNGFAKAPGYVVSSSVIMQEKMAHEMTKQYLEGNTVFGTAVTVGAEDGYVDFITDDPLYTETVPASVRGKMDEVVTKIKDGSLSLPSPAL